jgi:ribosome biogenesis GTPase A
VPSFLLDTTDPQTLPGQPSSSQTLLGHPSSSSTSPGQPSSTNAATKTHEKLSGGILPQRLIRLGLVGMPNAGKSSLTNFLAGGTVTAVSVRPETTRQAALGAFVDGPTQVRLHVSNGLGQVAW